MDIYIYTYIYIYGLELGSGGTFGGICRGLEKL